MVTIVDYGIGNVFSVSNAFNKLGEETELTSDPDRIRNASRLVLPGVGAFRVGMENLSKVGLVDPIRDFVKTGNPFMGICLGMQMLMDKSFEFGEYPGLGLIPGNVNKIPSENSNGELHKIPHIGWSKLEALSTGGAPWCNSVLHTTPKANSFYFVHSYSVSVESKNHLLAVTNYNKVQIQAAVRKNNVYGFQFHPEKSGKLGLDILRSFTSL